MEYTCPKCGAVCEANVESAEEIDVWCETCQEDITDQFDVYADYIGFQIDRNMDYLEDR